MARVFAIGIPAPSGDGSVVIVGRRIHKTRESAQEELATLTNRFSKAFISEEQAKPADFHAVFYRTREGALEFVVCFQVESMLEWEVLHRRAVSLYGWEDWAGRKYLDFIAKTYTGKNPAMRFSADCSNRLRALTDKEKPPAI